MFTLHWTFPLTDYTRFKFRPAFKDWATMALAKDHSYTPRTLCALGAIMDVSKANLDRAKTKSVKMFPAGMYLSAGQYILLAGRLGRKCGLYAVNGIETLTVRWHITRPFIHCAKPGPWGQY